MAAFSYTHSSLLLDSSPVLFQQPEFSQQPTSISSFTTCTAQFLHHDHDEIQSLTEKKQSPDSSTSSVVLDQNPPIGKQFTRKMSSVDKKRKDRDGFPSSTTAQSLRITKKRSPKGDNLKEKKKVQEADKKVQKKKVPEEVEITGYVHVRARRGEATDSHSLAERARREKISERMKLLQSLVPGCDKISGKTFVLDEIISYVQTLQTQVEFLSMKLASVDPLCNDIGRDRYAPETKPEVLDTHILPPQPTFQECFQECNTLEAMAYGDEQTKTSFNMPSSYPLLDSPQSIQFDNHLLMEMPNILHQDDFEQFLWDMEDWKVRDKNNLITTSMDSLPTCVLNSHLERC